MSDVQGILLHNILKDPKSSNEIWPKLKVYFFDTDYSQIYMAIVKYYNKFDKLPSFEELKITTRDVSLVQKIRALELLSVSEDIDINIAAEALTDQFTQDEVLEQLLKFLDKLPYYDSDDVKQKLAAILQDLEEKTLDSEDIILMNNVLVYDEEEIKKRINLGLNNEFDAKNAGVAQTELIMIGGYRGSGKTVAACNVSCNQYKQGNVGLFFSIEMRYREIFNRFISILSNVDSTRLKRRDCTPEELGRIALTRSNMFVDSEEVYQDYLKHRDYQKFEIELIRAKKLKVDNQLIIVDNQNLTLADIDMNIQKFKSQFGDKLKTVVVDYVNQINIPNIYEWQTQIRLSKALKGFARKYEIVMVTPYQTDTSGEARFSKGLLDAADISMNLKAEEKYINFKSTKTRGYSAFEFNAPVNWDTLEMSPLDAVIESEIKENKNSEQSGDIPWT